MNNIDIILKTKIEPDTSCARCNKAWCCKWAENYDLTDKEWKKLTPYIDEYVVLRMKQAIKDKEQFGSYDCAFLENNKCIAYKDRPITCRLHYVISSKKYCNSKKYPNRNIKMLNKIQLFLTLRISTIPETVTTMYEKYKDYLAL